MNRKSAFAVLSLCVLTLVCMLVLPVDSRADTVSSGTWGDGITWTLDDRGVMTVSGNGRIADNNQVGVYVPWYDLRENIKEVVVEGGITRIGKYAFRDCLNLEKVVLQNGVSYISDGAFWCYELKELHIPPSVYYVGNYGLCFGVADVYITDPSAWCNITFAHTYDNPLSNGTSTADKQVRLHVVDEFGEEESCVVLDESVSKIPAFAFKGSHLTEIIIPESVTNIEEYAFQSNQNLVFVVIPDSVREVSYYAFSGCSALQRVTIGTGLSELGYNVFENCVALERVTIPGNVTKISSGAFKGCTALATLMIESGVKSIGGSAFSGCTSLEEVTVPGTVESISYYAFQNCTSLTSLTLSEGLQKIGSRAFESCRGLTEVVIPDSVTTMEDTAFFMCRNLQSVTIGAGLTQIASCAFTWCDSLTSLTIPATVTQIGADAFRDSDQLADIYYNGTKAQWEQVIIGANNDPLMSAKVHFTGGTPGDMDGDEAVTTDDVIRLLLYVSMPETFPVDADADFTGDGKVTTDDVIQLLLYVSMPDAFPLKKNK